MTEQNIKLNIDEKSNVKTLIYELFSGVGFCNQLFSLETAIYLANISNRKLILLIRNPLCHCGKARWDYGKFLDYFNDTYKSYLPHGIEVYYRNPPSEIIEKINLSEKFQLKSSKYFSGCILIDKELNTNENKVDIDNFANGRKIEIIDYNSYNSEYLYISQSNASRCFYNFYTTKERYLLMNKICESLTYYNETITYAISKITTNFKYNAIHFRFGDSHKDKSIINSNNQLYLTNIKKYFTDTKIPLFIMTDRKDNELLTTLQQIYTIKFTDEYISNIELKTLIDTSVYKFIIEKSICQNSENFNGTIGSTVSNYIQYNRHINNKSSNYNLTFNVPINGIKYSWTNVFSIVSFACFFPDNIYNSIKIVGKNYFRYVNSINMKPIKNKKIISFCLYDIKKNYCGEMRKNRNFYKGIFINYEEAKTIYPDWIIRVYIPYNEPLEYIEKLILFKDIEVVLVDTNICFRALRFLPNDDPDVDIWLSRDTDSIVNWREKAAVDDWLENHSDKKLHIMTDNLQHYWTIAGGMFGIQNKVGNKSNILDYLLTIDTNINTYTYAYDCIAAEKFFYNDTNYIQYHSNGKLLSNSKNFPKHKPIFCFFVGNVIDIDKLYSQLELEKKYPILIFDNNNIIKNGDNFLYTPWKGASKNKDGICTVLWNNDDFKMVANIDKPNGSGTFTTFNQDGLKLLNIGTTIKILWDNHTYRECYMSDKDTICVKFNDNVFKFTRVNNSMYQIINKANDKTNNEINNEINNEENIVLKISNLDNEVNNIVFYSNCQYLGIAYFLKKIYNKAKFSYITNYDLIHNKKPINIDLIKSADIFIYQQINKIHGIYSTDESVNNNILTHLSKKCIKLSFPYIYNSSLWILIPPAHIDGYIGDYPDMSKYINREPIEKLKIDGYSLEKIIELYKTEQIDFEFEKRFNNSIKILKEKEKLCDITVSDYIINNIRKHKLFFTQNHPTTSIFIHCVNQILEKLDRTEKFNYLDYPENVSNLPNKLSSTSYDKKYWNFEYDIGACNPASYIPHIERIYNNYKVYENIYPLGFSIPECCIQPVNIKLKQKEFATVIPGKSITYIFKNKLNEYNYDYEISKFGFTFKKGGWDCLRHYEILANNCIPFFIDIDECPEHTLHLFPKKIIKEILELYKNKNLTDELYEKYIYKLNDYTKTHLTCEKMAEYFLTILKKYKNIDNPKILMVTNGGLNYSMAILAYGLRKNIGTNFVDNPKIKHIYKDCHVFNLSLLNDDPDIDRNDIQNKINNKYFDYIIFGSVGPDDVNFIQHAKKISNYNNTEKIFIFGGDRPFNMKLDNHFKDTLLEYQKYGICFVRELDYFSNYYHEDTWSKYCNECFKLWQIKANLCEKYL